MSRLPRMPRMPRLLRLLRLLQTLPSGTQSPLPNAAQRACLLSRAEDAEAIEAIGEVKNNEARQSADRPSNKILRRLGSQPARFAALMPLVPLILTLLLTLPTAVIAQGGEAVPESRIGPPTRLAGTVTDHLEKEVPSAQVRLSKAGNQAGVDVDEESRRETQTDRKGRWSLSDLKPGRWDLTISSPGYVDAQGFVLVRRGTNPPVEIILRPVTELSSFGSEGHPTAIKDWLEKGNSLLAQEQWTEARAEYARALRELPDQDKPEVLRAVARTHFMEKNVDEAVESLKLALILVPEDKTSRQLFSALLSGSGREQEEEAFWNELETLQEEYRQKLEGQKAAAAEQQKANFDRIRAIPIVEPETGRTGSYRVRFAAQHPLSKGSVFAKRFEAKVKDLEAIDGDGGEYAIEEETFQVHVPKSYAAPSAPSADSEPSWGLIVWISPTPFGGFREEEIADVLAEHRLIWVGANFAGNARWKWDRYHLALDAAHNMPQWYRIDPERVYVGGYSGGGRATSALTLLYPEVFGGGFCVMGVDFFRTLAVPDRPGSVWQAALPTPAKGDLQKVRDNQHFVLLTGSRDFNRAQTKEVYKAMKKDGFRHVTYLEVPDATHYTGLVPEWVGKAFAALDGKHHDGKSNDSSSGQR